MTIKQNPLTPVRLVDRAHEAGINTIYDNGSAAKRSSILESLGGGVGLLDFDGDGETDLIYPGGGQFTPEPGIVGLPTALYRHVGPWQFHPCGLQAAISSPRHYTHGTCIADYDHDGWDDVLLTGYGGVQLWHNAGDGTFTDETDSAGLVDKLWSTSAAWADINGDGHLDLYLAHYVDWSFSNDPVCPGPTEDLRETCSPRRFQPLPDTLYYSRGDGQFADESETAYLKKEGKGLGVLAADFDLDGDTDLYVGNDTVPNFFYRNNGKGQLEEIGQLSATALSDMATADGSMGVAVLDYNLDGLPDIWVANFERESFALYRNEGNCFFQHVSQMTGITAVGGLYVGFGTVAFDADLDGDEDLWVTNGHVIQYPTNTTVKQVPLLFENRDGKRMVNVASETGTYANTPHLGRGVAIGDLDHDGDLDLVVTHTLEPHALLENQLTTTNGWLQVRLIGRTSNRSAIGARLELHTTQGVQVRQVFGGGSYLSSCDRKVCWGLPQDAEPLKLVIRWPSGQTQEITSLKLNSSITFVEP